MSEPGTGATLPPWVGRVLRSPLPPFAVLTFFLFLVHEPWMDEAQAWLLVRDTNGPVDLFRHMSYEGSPGLWHLLLVPLIRAGLPIESMSFLHALLAIATVAVLVLWSPFKRWEMWLISFSYFFAYEYNAIARSYVLTALLLLILASLHPRRTTSPWPYAACLALLANSNAYGLWMAFVLGCEQAWSLWQARPLTPKAWALVASAAGGLAAVAQLIPRSDLYPRLRVWHFEYPFDYYLRRFADVTYAAFLPVPRDFWNPDYSGWDSIFLDALPPVLSLVVMVAAVFALRRHLAAQVLFLAFSVGLFTIFLFKQYWWGAHHAGTLLLAFLFCLWLSREHERTRAPPARAAARGRGGRGPMTSARRSTSVFLAIVMVTGVFVTAEATYWDTRWDFSMGKRMAHVLEEGHLLEPGILITAYPSEAAVPVLVHLDPKIRFFQLEQDHMGSFAEFTRETGSVQPKDVIPRLRNVSEAQAAERNLVLSRYPLSLPNATTLVSLDGAIQPTGNLYLYDVTRSIVP